MKFKNIPENGVGAGNELPHNCYSVYHRIKSLFLRMEWIWEMNCHKIVILFIAELNL